MVISRISGAMPYFFAITMMMVPNSSQIAFRVLGAPGLRIGLVPLE